jgi:hypothetical protein
MIARTVEREVCSVLASTATDEKAGEVMAFSEPAQDSSARLGFRERERERERAVSGGRTSFYPFLFLSCSAKFR